MSEHLLIGIASIIVAGVGAQWLAWWLKLPSIVILLGLGFIAGPISGLIKPDEVLGPLLLPLVSICVAIILFEGGLGLRFYELKQIGKVVFNLVTLGVLINGALITLSAHFILGLNFTISILLGAILVVTGPTVIIPLLRHIRPSGKVGSIIKWEGIVIDPVGAALAVLAFEFIINGHGLTFTAVVFFLKGVLMGALIGAAAAWLLLFLLRKYWIPDYLHGTVALMLVITVFTLSNFFHKESGLFTVIIMGMVLGNQRKVEVQQIVSFKENLGVLIISILFIILAARLNFHDLSILDWRFVYFLIILVIIARPVSVFLSTIRCGLSFKEKLFMSMIAPRGIVAAAIASVFAFELSEKGIPQAEYLVPVAFLVIVGTVVIYGMSSSWVAHKLGLACSNPQGILLLGAHSMARCIATVLQKEEIKVILIDSNAKNVELAQEEGLDAYEENILSRDVEENIDLSGIGRLVTLTANDEANSFAALNFREIFGRSETYQLYPGRKSLAHKITIPPGLRGRFLFSERIKYDYLTEQLSKKDAVKSLIVSEDLNFESFQLKYGRDVAALFSINEKKALKIFTADEKFFVKKGQKLIFINSV